ncbi:glycosyltransferase [Roseateles cavernae]|uniref:glycosyltransferase n=1 Tax=Roseateles cavernae TaxID=3153578 RepID=UPI0032E45A79
MAIAAISVVSHGHGEMLDHVLRDLENQTVHDHLLVIVTLNLEDEIFDPSRYPGLRISVIKNSSPRGFGANHNSAFAQCHTEWFFILNPDVRLPCATAIADLIHKAGNTAGLMSPRIMNSSGGWEDAVRPNLSLSSLMARVLVGRRESLLATVTRKGMPFFWVAGMFMVVRSEVFRKIGGFDHRYFLYCEDYDLCARIYLAGHEIMVRDDVQVIHDAQRDSHRSSRHLRWHLESLLKVWSSSAFWRVVFS